MKTLVPAIVVLGVIFAIIGYDTKATTPQSRPAATHPAAAGKELALDLGDKVALKLERIPAGKFLMGSPETESGHRKDELPHRVTISKPFYMGITPVTVDQFSAFANDSGYKTEAEKYGFSIGIEVTQGALVGRRVNGCSWRNPSFPQKGNSPVVQISWDDATAFCDWLSKKSGKAVALPTEAQWEYACRAGTTTAYPWGNNPNDGKGCANCADQSFKKKYPTVRMVEFTWDDGFANTSPVASFKPNAWGLYDMIGNTSQWCQDWYGPYDNEPVTDPTGAATGNTRVRRGGGWNSEKVTSRSAFRIGSTPVAVQDDSFGFRVVAAAD